MRLAVLALTLSVRVAAADNRCVGDYADDVAALSPQARDIEAHTSSYSYAVRTQATYECVSYGSDGNLKTTRASQTAYGTAFGYRHDGGDTLLLTNQHVAEWPLVTDSDHAVDGVPSGCKRVWTGLKIVDNDQDDYAADDIPLTEVAVDPTLDVAVLKAKQKLEIMPWKVGHSSGIAPRNAIEVKGFPLGAFRATNLGKVVSAYDHDDFGMWDHDDFVVDALLTHGGSGSPVFAVSCKTGEWELVGIFHAHYSNANALNVIVAIDQVKELMTTLKRSSKPGAATLALDPAARARVIAATRGDDPPFFSFGPLTASVRARPDGGLVFAVYPQDFPASTRPVLVIEDEPDAKTFGTLGKVYVGGDNGLQVVTLAEADADTQTQMARALTMLRTDAVTAFDYRMAAPHAEKSRDSYERVVQQKKAMNRLLDSQHEGVASAVDLAKKLKGSGSTVRLSDLEAPLTTASAPASQTAAIEVTH